MREAEKFMEYVTLSPSAFHAVAQIADRLEGAGYARIQEQDAWGIRPGGKYYVTRNQSSLLAFDVPEGGFDHFQITASHTDSPTFKLKPAAEETVDGKYVRLNTETYGGIMMTTWFDRPLSIAGRALVKTEKGVEARLVKVDRDLAMIPNVPIHFNREINDGYKINPQVDTLPLIGDGSAKGELAKLVAEACGAAPEDVVSSDLFLYSRTPASRWGAKGEYFSCGRIDDLECAWTSAEAFIAAKARGHVNVLAVLDNEETGSRTRQGADSDLLFASLYRISESLGLTAAQYYAAVSASFMVSADNAHALHPNHGEKYDADNRCYMNEGIVIKHNASQRYTTDAVSGGVFETVCKSAGVPVQHFANRSDTPGGGTLGNIANAHLSMATVDIGLAQLAMHSCCETAGVEDVDHMIAGLKAFYDANIRMTGDGIYEIEGREEDK